MRIEIKHTESVAHALHNIKQK